MGTTIGVTQTTGLYAAGEDCTVDNEWFVTLMQLEWFQELVKERWNEKKDVFLQALDIAWQQEEQYRTYFFEDYQMWHADDITEGETMASLYQNQYIHMYYWTMGRYNWLDAYFNGLDEVAETPYYEFSF